MNCTERGRSIDTERSRSMGRIMQGLWKPILEQIEQLERKLMASIEQPETQLDDAKSAIADLEEAVAEEKQEIVGKLTLLDNKITEQTGLIEQLKEQIAGTVPDSALTELANATASIRETTSEIRNIVQAPVTIG
jgi:chromosome segregation ATPase